MRHLTACKISVSLSFLNWIKNKMIFLSYLWINVANNVTHLMIVLIPYINLLNLSWIKLSIFQEYGALI